MYPTHMDLMFIFSFQQSRFQDMSNQIIGKIDDMGSRIDDLEKSIGELMEHAGADETTNLAESVIDSKSNYNNGNSQLRSDS